jgi:uncharacterized protein (TIGR02145 family)
MKTSMLLLLFILNYLPNSAQETGTFKDPRDGKVYKTVKIESQWIMAENLAYKPISGNFWTYDNKPNNLEKYGYMYDWETAKIIAPKGWHLPSKEEWEQFYKALGNDASKVYEAIKTNGSSGFNSVLSGYRHDDGKYSFEGSTAHFWSSTAESEFNAWNFNCYGDDKLAIINRHRKLSGLSVRLLQDK